MHLWAYFWVRKKQRNVSAGISFEHLSPGLPRTPTTSCGLLAFTKTGKRTFVLSGGEAGTEYHLSTFNNMVVTPATYVGPGPTGFNVTPTQLGQPRTETICAYTSTCTQTLAVARGTVSGHMHIHERSCEYTSSSNFP